jgi:hypothetical protein
MLLILFLDITSGSFGFSRTFLYSQSNIFYINGK